MDYLDKQKESPDKEDFVMSGMFVSVGLIAVIGFLVYLFTIQVHAKNCQPKFDANGQITNNCPPPAPNTNSAPAAAQPGQIQFLNLNQQKIPQLDGN